MSEQQTVAADAESGNSDATQKRQRSSIAFPYDALNEAAAIADKIHANVGTGSCDLSQISAWTDQSIKSSGFRSQIAAARLFGLIEGEGSDYRLTALGRRLADPQTVAMAKAEAFLNVPLFSALFTEYKDGVLPPPAALERQIAKVGVAEKQKGRARQIFERSAQEAGFFAFGKDRLVKPAFKGGDSPPPGTPDGNPRGNEGDQDEARGRPRGNQDSGNELDLDPLLMALLRKIPKAGDVWPKEKRLRWFKTFAMNVSQVYDDEDDDPIEIKCEA